MARPREFDTDDALERAMQVFWQHGYEEASLPDLLTGMGLTRGSLYKAFQDKKHLFLLVLNRYELAQVDTGAALLKDSGNGPGQARITAFFENLVRAVAAGDHRGCLLCTAAAGSAADDEDIAQVVHQGLVKLQQALIVAVADIDGITSADHAQLANTLLTQYIGLRMLARSRLPLGILENSVAGVTSILDNAVTGTDGGRRVHPT